MSIGANLEAVRQRVAEAAARAGRSPQEIRLVGVSKGSPTEAVIEAVQAGLSEIGENRVQEAAAKIPAVNAAVAQKPTWHLIGHLQSNKAKAALELFDTVEAVDSLTIAQTLSRRATRNLPVFLEVQFAHTPDRFGFDPAEISEAYRSVCSLPNLEVVGLMTVAPLGVGPEGTRQVFRELREIRDRLQEVGGRGSLELSMGMTDDYPIAIEEGATLIRVGRAIFAH